MFNALRDFKNIIRDFGFLRHKKEYKFFILLLKFLKSEYHISKENESIVENTFISKLTDCVEDDFFVFPYQCMKVSNGFIMYRYFCNEIIYNDLHFFNFQC